MLDTYRSVIASFTADVQHFLQCLSKRWRRPLRCTFADASIWQGPDLSENHDEGLEDDHVHMPLYTAKQHKCAGRQICCPA